MTRKEKIAYLKSYHEASENVKALLVEREKILTIATKITTSYSQTPTTHNDISSKIESSAIRLYEIEEKINKEIDDFSQRRDNIEKIIDTAEKSRYRVVLKYRFISQMRYEDIAETTNTTVRNVRFTLNNAIDSLDI